MARGAVDYKNNICMKVFVQSHEFNGNGMKWAHEFRIFMRTRCKYKAKKNYNFMNYC